MVEFDIRPNEFTLGNVTHPSVVLKVLNSKKKKKQFHAVSIKLGLQSKVYVGNALLDPYAVSRKLFFIR